MSNIEKIVNNPFIGEKKKLAMIRVALGITPHPNDVPDSEPWIIEAVGGEYVGFRNRADDPQWVAFSSRTVGHASYFSDVDVKLIHRLVKDSGDMDQQVEEVSKESAARHKERMDRMNRKWQAQQKEINSKNNRIKELEGEVKRLKASIRKFDESVSEMFKGN